MFDELIYSISQVYKILIIQKKRSMPLKVSKKNWKPIARVFSRLGFNVSRSQEGYVKVPQKSYETLMFINRKRKR